MNMCLAQEKKSEMLLRKLCKICAYQFKKIEKTSKKK